MKSVKKSNFGSLVEYISDDQEKKERVEYTSVTNCQSNNLNAAIIEVTAVQGMNTRAESDKTYHLVLSFRPGERPDNKTLKEVENSICEGLGYGEHQRVSALHCDTDNLHVHIAINKIHPTRLTIHTPYNDYKVLGILCEMLEIKHGLERDNHLASKVSSENRADDMEHHAGIESLLGWVKRECLEQLQAAGSWSDFHNVLHEHGLELRARGNGFVITNPDGLMVKASSVSRDLSKSKLENKFGQFEPSLDSADKTTQTSKPKKEYEAKPTRSRIDTTLLFAKYQNEQRNQGAIRSEQWKLTREDKIRRIEAAKRAAKLKRAVIKLSVKSRIEKKLLYSLTSKALLAEIKQINESYQLDRQKIFENHRPQQWADWLRRKAKSGDAEALDALRARELGQRFKGNTIGTAGGRRVSQRVNMRQDSVTKKGTIIYRVGASAVRDDGDNLKVSRGASAAGLEVALKMAMARYGNTITVNGSDAFKAQIVMAAVASRLQLSFADAGLEQQRLSLLQATEHRNEQVIRGSGLGGHTGGSGSAVGNANSERDGNGRRGVFGNSPKPNVGRVGQRPPPESRNRLRDLSSLAVVRIASGIEVLLSGNVSNRMDQQTPESDNALRRGISRPGLGVSPEADKYIAEREEKRLKGIDISIHRRYNEADAGTLAFAGIRQVDGQYLALLKREDEIAVLPVDEKVVGRMRRLLVGDSVSVSSTGKITTSKGRGR